MRTLVALAAAAAVALLGGCSPDPAPPSPTPSASSIAPSAPPSSSSPPLVSESPTAPAPSTTPSGSTDPSLIPGADCLTGTWRLVRFIGLGEQATYGTGQGGDVTVAFNKGRYTLVGNGVQPITLNLAGSAASLLVDGRVAGTYAPDGASMTFTVGQASGQGTLKAGDQSQILPMAQVAQVIAPSGKATMACPQGNLLIALPTVRLEFAR